MVGKQWSPAEERFFWKRVVPRSPKRLGIHRLNPEESWDRLADVMQKSMGNDARRTYTGLSLFEHWFQNVVLPYVSKHAVRYAAEYKSNMTPEEKAALERRQDDRARRPRTTKAKRDRAALAVTKARERAEQLRRQSMGHGHEYVKSPGMDMDVGVLTLHQRMGLGPFSADMTVRPMSPSCHLQLQLQQISNMAQQQVQLGISHDQAQAQTQPQSQTQSHSLRNSVGRESVKMIGDAAQENMASDGTPATDTSSRDEHSECLECAGSVLGSSGAGSGFVSTGQDKENDRPEAGTIVTNVANSNNTTTITKPMAADSAMDKFDLSLPGYDFSFDGTRILDSGFAASGQTESLGNDGIDGSIVALIDSDTAALSGKPGAGLQQSSSSTFSKASGENKATKELANEAAGEQDNPSETAHDDGQDMETVPDLIDAIVGMDSPEQDMYDPTTPMNPEGDFAMARKCASLYPMPAMTSMQSPLDVSAAVLEANKSGNNDTLMDTMHQFPNHPPPVKGAHSQQTKTQNRNQSQSQSQSQSQKHGKQDMMEQQGVVPFTLAGSTSFSHSMTTAASCASPACTMTPLQSLDMVGIDMTTSGFDGMQFVDLSMGVNMPGSINTMDMAELNGYSMPLRMHGFPLVNMTGLGDMNGLDMNGMSLGLGGGGGAATTTNGHGSATYGHGAFGGGAMGMGMGMRVAPHAAPVALMTPSGGGGGGGGSNADGFQFGLPMAAQSQLMHIQQMHQIQAHHQQQQQQQKQQQNQKQYQHQQKTHHHQQPQQQQKQKQGNWVEVDGTLYFDQQMI